MKRFHVHIAVEKLDESIRFYSALFGASPAVVKPDYAKWMLDDPRLNFAISQRGHTVGLNHLGFQVDTDETLKSLRKQLETADASVVEQTAASCCYALSDKHWVTDPSGIAWETFQSRGAVAIFGEDAQTGMQENGCCIPVKQSDGDGQTAGCCIPSTQDAAKTDSAACCR